MARPRLLRALAALGASGIAACTPTPWDPPGLRPHRTVLGAHAAHRLFDATPYLLPIRGELVEFFCRWPTDRPLGVHLPEDATADELRALDAALAAWEAAALGVRFERVPRERAEIDIAFLSPAQTQRAEGTGYTLADCLLEDVRAEAVARSPLTARMSIARIRIVRRESDEWTAEDHAWFAGEVAGVVLHELAHALGFQGHARFGGGILAPDTKQTTGVGRRVLRGGVFSEPTLRALYSLPSGVVLSRRPVPPVRTGPLDERLRTGKGRVWVRVGDRSGRIHWLDEDGSEHGVTLVSVATARSRPERLVLLPF